MKKKKTTEEYLNQVKKIHGNKYDYSEVSYNGCFERVKITCKTCGKIFFPTACAHLQGTGCPHCNKSKTTEEFIKQAKHKHHDKYNYDKVVYKDAKSKIKIFCNTCKKYFNQSPGDHLSGYGCPYCGLLKCQTHKRSNKEEFVKKAVKLYGKAYNYDKVKYFNSKSKIKIFCNKCEQYFITTPGNHIQGVGCPFCRQSHGEIQIHKILENNKIIFERQKRFKDCKDKHTLPFDFYLPKQNICIEFQGEQHYKPNFYKKYIKDHDKLMSVFSRQQNHDKIKKEYCKNNNIFLYEITYQDSIEEKLKTLFDHYIK